MIRTTALVLLTLGIARGQQQATRPAQLPFVDLPTDLARILRDYESAWHARDAKKLAALFTEDGFVLSSGRAPVRGRSAIEQHYATAGGLLSLRALAYSTEGRIGYIIGAFSQTPNDPDIGKFTLTLRKTAEGRWLIMSDMDNANRRP